MRIHSRLAVVRIWPDRKGNMKINEFVKKHDINFDVRPVEQRPDGVSNDTMRHYQCIIGNRHNLKSFRLYVSQPIEAVKPTVYDVLQGLAQNAAEYEPMRLKKRADQFLLWCANMGYKFDSRKAEKEFKSMRRQVNQLRRTLGVAAYNELIEFAKSGDIELETGVERARKISC